MRVRRTVKSAAGNPEAVEDTTVVEAAGDQAVLKVESPAPDGSVAARELRQPVPPDKALREEKLAVGGSEVACVVVSGGGITSWIPKEGPAAGWALKQETPEASSAATALSEETVRVGQREVKCLKMEIEGEADGKPLKGTVWLSTAVPGFVARQSLILGEGDQEVRTDVEVLAFGEDASQKPPFPAAKMPEPPREERPKEEPPKEPPPKAAEAVLADAERCLIEGAPIFKELAEATRQMPDDETKLRALLRRHEEALALFVKAREAYLSVRDRAPEEAKVGEKIEKTEKILALLQKYGEAIKSRLK